MTPASFWSLLQEHLLPLLSGAMLVPDAAPSPPARPAVVQRSRHSIEIKPSQATPWCFTITRIQPFAPTGAGSVTEKALARAFVDGLATMPPGFEVGPYAADLMARFGRRLVVSTLCPEAVERRVVLAAIDQLEMWSARSYEGQPIVAALGFDPATAAVTAAASKSAVSLCEVWAEEFSAVLSNSFDTMLVADGEGHVLSYEALAAPAPAHASPLVPVRLGAVAQWCAQHPDRLVLVLNRADELLVLRHGELVFTRRAGRWFFLAPEAIIQQMGGVNSIELRRAVYASCLDVSFAGSGACLGILNSRNTRSLRGIAPDFGDHLCPPRSAKARLLQRAIKGQPFQNLDRRLRQEIMAIDGATILDHQGQILAAGAILKVPGGSSGGGRRAAAEALAKLGVGIKVSADGGIVGFKRARGFSAPDGQKMSFQLMG